MIDNRAARRHAKKGKGYPMREISEEELAKRRKRNKIAKQSRKVNRGK